MPIERRRVLYVSPADDIHAALLATVGAATTSIHITAYGLTLPELGDLLIAKHQAGVTVDVVADKTQSAGRAQRILLQRLVDAGILVTIATAPGGAINHEKAVLVDMALGAEHNGSLTFYGSWNMSASANRQENHAQVDNDPSVCQLFAAQFAEAKTYGQTHCRQLSPTAPS